jgi:hypothetical protein
MKDDFENYVLSNFEIGDMFRFTTRFCVSFGFPHVFLEGGGAYSSVVFAVNITNSQYIYFSQFIASLFIS